jgi:hypothetical protein
MPHLPMPPTNESNYEKNTKEQYEALGRFVEAFELMVNEVREVCIERICTGVGSSEREHLVEISFHHQAMTAKPLYDIMRAIIAELVNKPTSRHHADNAKIKALLGHIEGEYNHLYNKRNELLHGTWLIGYVSADDPDASEFLIRKYKTSADGLVAAKELPKNAPELLTLRDRCAAVRNWIGHVDFCLQDGHALSEFFKCDDKTWFFRFSEASNWTTLPKR